MKAGTCLWFSSLTAHKQGMQSVIPDLHYNRADVCLLIND